MFQYIFVQLLNRIVKILNACYLNTLYYRINELTSLGPATTTLKYLALLSSGTACMPVTGSAIKRCVS